MRCPLRPQREQALQQLLFDLGRAVFAISGPTAKNRHHLIIGHRSILS
jgi:hypothetical protein